MKIGVIGAGRLGICFALLCEQAGYDVLVSDIREDYVNDLNNKKITTNEPEVEDLLRVSKNFRATTDNKEVIDECDLIYTLVSTPSLEDGSYDVSSVWRVLQDFEGVKKKKYFVVGCTTNPGDCENFSSQLPNNVKVLYNPEFIAQGTIVSDLRQADMVLLGVDQNHENDQTVNEIRELYKKIQTKRSIVFTMSTKAAEITKIAVNCFLTTKISYANMLGDVLSMAGCGDEIVPVLGAIGSDSRIGRKFLGWGVGYGGPCLPRDNRAFAHFAESVGLKYNLGYVTDGFNNEHAKIICDYWDTLNKDKKPFYFEYITYKKGTDILTESQQYRLALDLLDRGYKIYIQNDRRVTPQVSEYLDNTYGDRVRFVDNKDNINEGLFIINL
jgi:nucleotide sugar dehydrogenase